MSSDSLPEHTNAELGERIARVEAKQDQLIETVDEVAALEVPERLGAIETKQDTIVEKLDEATETIDQELSSLRADHETVATRTTKLWHGYQLVKWGGGTAGLLAIALRLFL